MCHSNRKTNYIELSGCLLTWVCCQANDTILESLRMSLSKFWPKLSVLQALKEKTELQAQLATVNAQLQVKTEEAQVSQDRRSALTSQVGTMRQNCSQLEKAMVELQGSLESKNASLASLSNDLKVAEDQYNRLMGKVEEMQNTVVMRDNTGDWWRPREQSLKRCHHRPCC